VILNDVKSTADCTAIWGILTAGARPRCRAMSRRAAKLNFDRGIVGIIGIVVIIELAEGQTGPHYCSRRTVIVCTKEHVWK
jgi:hypothetical protein